MLEKTVTLKWDKLVREKKIFVLKVVKIAQLIRELQGKPMRLPFSDKAFLVQIKSTKNKYLCYCIWFSGPTAVHPCPALFDGQRPSRLRLGRRRRWLLEQGPQRGQKVRCRRGHFRRDARPFGEELGPLSYRGPGGEIPLARGWRTHFGWYVYSLFSLHDDQ